MHSLLLRVSGIGGISMSGTVLLTVRMVCTLPGRLCFLITMQSEGMFLHTSQRASFHLASRLCWQWRSFLRPSDVYSKTDSCPHGHLVTTEGTAPQLRYIFSYLKNKTRIFAFLLRALLTLQCLEMLKREAKKRLKNSTDHQWSSLRTRAGSLSWLMQRTWARSMGCTKTVRHPIERAHVLCR